MLIDLTVSYCVTYNWEISYEQLARHRFASHVVQTLLDVAQDTISREVRP